MRKKPSWSVLCTLIFALTQMGCASFRRPPPPQTARVSPQLLVPPPILPSPQPAADGTMNGKAIMGTFTQVYDVAGGIRNTLIELQREVIIAQGKPPKEQSK